MFKISKAPKEEGERSKVLKTLKALKKKIEGSQLSTAFKEIME